MNYVFEILENEYWWGGATKCGTHVPLTRESRFKVDLRGTKTRECSNQSMPLLLSSKGRYIWSDQAIAFEFKDGSIYVEGEKEVRLYNAGSSLKDAYIEASRCHFPSDGKKLQEKFFTTAQYNTWMHCTYNPTQESVLEYAHELLDSGFEPGILIIDEGWHKPYGTWEFDEIKFPAPKAMTEELHSLGFTILLWVCPFVTCSGENYIKSLGLGSEVNDEAVMTDMYLRLDDGGIALIKWWNGITAVLDFTKQCDWDFMKNQLDQLVTKYGIDGFKLDGGQIFHYSDMFCVNGKVNQDKTHYERNIAWNEFGRQYAYHEYKDTYKGGGKCKIQRLLDRAHSWNDEGINTIIPYCLLVGLLGMPFICPDMIGGGQWNMFLRGVPFDEELFVRMCQVSTLFPMMQFSILPSKHLSEENKNICVDMAKLHKSFSPYIIDQVNKSRVSGEPIVRHMAYEFPNEEYELCLDYFMLGDRYLIAPVLEKGAVTKSVRLPEGHLWKYADGKTYQGGRKVVVDAPLNVLPYFEKLSLQK